MQVKSFKIVVKETKNASIQRKTSESVTSKASLPSVTRTALAFSKSPGSRAACPVEGYCLNRGTCSFLPWLGELSCTCASGFKGARCEQKSTSANYFSYRMINNRHVDHFFMDPGSERENLANSVPTS